LDALRIVRDPKQSSGVVNNDFSNFDLEVIGGLPQDWVFISPGSRERTFTADSTAAIAFTASFLLSGQGNAKKLWIQINAGSPSKRQANSVIVEFSPSVESNECARAILDLCVAFWQPHHAFAGRAAVQRTLNQQPGAVRIGWLTYLADSAASQFLPAHIRWQPLGPGLVIQTSAIPGFVNDALGIDNMKRVLVALAAHGLLSGPPGE
jgi:hypothetical protein